MSHASFVRRPDAAVSASGSLSRGKELPSGCIRLLTCYYLLENSVHCSREDIIRVRRSPYLERIMAVKLSDLR